VDAAVLAAVCGPVNAPNGSTSGPARRYSASLRRRGLWRCRIEECRVGRGLGEDSTLLLGPSTIRSRMHSVGFRGWAWLHRVVGRTPSEGPLPNLRGSLRRLAVVVALLTLGMITPAFVGPADASITSRTAITTQATSQTSSFAPKIVSNVPTRERRRVPSRTILLATTRRGAHVSPMVELLGLVTVVLAFFGGCVLMFSGLGTSRNRNDEITPQPKARANVYIAEQPRRRSGGADEYRDVGPLLSEILVGRHDEINASAVCPAATRKEPAMRKTVSDATADLDKVVERLRTSQAEHLAHSKRLLSEDGTVWACDCAEWHELTSLVASAREGVAPSSEVIDSITQYLRGAYEDADIALPDFTFDPRDAVFDAFADGAVEVYNKVMPLMGSSRGAASSTAGDRCF
jgi:hypothetical protein